MQGSAGRVHAMNPLRKLGQLHARIERLLVPVIVCLATALVAVYLLKIVWR
jgi:hypothetical protein